MKILGLYCIMLLFSMTLYGGGGPENVAVVVNGDSWASLTIANEFVRLRNIPTSNIVHLHKISSYETITVEEFRKQILLPVLETLEKRGLAGQIDYIAYSSDLPYCINFSEDAPENKYPGIIPFASLTGLTYLYQATLNKFPYWGMQTNQYLCQPYLGAGDTPWKHSEKALYQQAMILFRQQKWQQARQLLEKLKNLHPQSPSLLYNLSCCVLQQNDSNKGMEYLEQAIEAGWGNYHHTLQDPDIQKLRNHPKFQELLHKMQNIPILYNVDSQGFRNSYSWANFGALVLPKEGSRYLLSVMLGFTSGRGNSISEVLSYLQKASKCDGQKPQGTFYFMINDDIRAKTRQPLFSSAIAVLEKMGMKAKIEHGFLPENKPDVLGLVAGVATFSWPTSQSNIINGAICEHLTSFGGILKQEKSQTPLSEWLRYGAAGSSGTVTEPYAIAGKFPSSFLHVHYARGCTLAEAFYQSVQAPYQLLIVGDPLCRPWAVIPEVVCDLIPESVYSGMITIQPNVVGNVPIHHYELFVAGRRIAACRPQEYLAFDSRILPDGLHQIRVVAVCDDSMQTQGRKIIPIFVKNYGLKLEILAIPKKVWYNENFSIEATLPGAKEIIVYHQSRQLDSISSDRAKFQISTKTLGMGQISLDILGIMPNNHSAMARVSFEIFPPKPILPLEDSVVSNSKKRTGLALIIEAGKKINIPNTLDWNWLLKNGVKEDSPFFIEGCFDVTEPTLAQFQLNGLGKIQLTVNSTPLCNLENNEFWQYIPISLLPGRHTFTIHAKLKNPILDLRYGSVGTYSIQDNFYYFEK